MGSGTTIVADSVRLSPGTNAWDVFTNRLRLGRGATVTGTQQPVPPPIYQTQPLFIPDPFIPANYPPGYPPTCGGPDRVLNKGESLVLPPGRR